MGAVGIGVTVSLNQQVLPATVETLTIDATNELVGAVFFATHAGDISAIGFKTGTVGTPKTLRIGVQSIDAATGLNTGTWLGAAAAGYYDQTNPASDTEYLVTLGAVVPTAVGTQYAVVVKWADDGDPGVVGILAVATSYTFLNSSLTFIDPTSNSCYALNPTVAITSSFPMFGLSYSGVFYKSAVSPVIATIAASVSLDADGTIREAGNRFLCPISCRAAGVSLRGDVDQNIECHIYSDAGTSLASLTLDKDVRVSTAASTFYAYFATPVNLTAGTWYRVAAKATSNTAANALSKIVYSSNAQLGQLDGGINCYYTSKGSGAWDDTETAARGTITVLIDQIIFPDAANVTEDDTVNGATGTYHEATEAEVQDGVQFGAASALTGTYTGGGGGRPEIRGSNL